MIGYQKKLLRGSSFYVFMDLMMLVQTKKTNRFLLRLCVTPSQCRSCERWSRAVSDVWLQVAVEMKITMDAIKLFHGR